jgi:hypothetical protein
MHELSKIMYMSHSRILVFNGSHFEPLNVDDNGRLNTNIFTSQSLDVNVVSSTGTILVDGSGVTQPVSATSLPLPTGAATESTLSSINTALTGTIVVDGSGVTQPVSATSLPLPTGAATESTLSSINTALTGTIVVDGSGVTQPVSATSLPLPTGAATESTLSGINTKITAVNTGDVTVTSSPIITGSDGGTATDVMVDASGVVATKMVHINNIGSFGNAWNNSSIGPDDQSTKINVEHVSRCNIFLHDTDYQSVDTYSIWVSVDDTNYHMIHILYPYDKRATASVREDHVSLDVHGLKYLYIENNGALKNSVYASVYGST